MEENGKYSFHKERERNRATTLQTIARVGGIFPGVILCDRFWAGAGPQGAHSLWWDGQWSIRGLQPPQARAPTSFSLPFPWAPTLFCFGYPFSTWRCKLHEIKCTYVKSTVWGVLRNVCPRVTTTPVRMKHISSTQKVPSGPSPRHWPDFCLSSAYSRISQTWNHLAFAALSVAPFIQHHVRKMQSSCCTFQRFIPLYCWGAFPGRDVPRLIYAFPCWRTQRRFLHWAMEHRAVDTRGLASVQTPAFISLG